MSPTGKEHPALLAADAAEAALRGFAEIETTVAVARYAPFNALAILVGAQTGRGGVLTQCAVEEATNLHLGFKGLTSYSETLSVYGDRARVRRRRRHAVVEGVPRRRLREPRRQDALHVRRRRAGADGLRGRQVDAVPRGAQPAGRRGPPGARARRTVRSAASRCRNRCPTALRAVTGREPDRDAARHGSGFRQRRARLALGDPQGGEADAAVHSGHRFHHLRVRRRSRAATTCSAAATST